MPADTLGLGLTRRPAAGLQLPSGVFHSEAFAANEAGSARLRADPLIGEWERLCRRVSAMPFVRPQWVCAWWRAFAAEGDELVLWYLRRDGRITALLPLVRRGHTLLPALNYHTPQSSLLAEDNAAAEALVCALLLAGHATEVTFAALDSLGVDVDICRWAGAKAGHALVTLPHERACYLTLDAGWDVYETRLGRDTRGDVRRRRRRLQEHGSVSFTVHTGGDNLERLLDTAFVLESSGWKLQSHSAIRSDARVERFYTEIARWAALEDMLRLCFLRVDGTPIAMQFNLEHRGVWYLLKCGYDARFAHGSPGKVMQHDCIRHCFAAGIKCIEFCGDEDPHKMRWSPQSRELQRLHFFPASLPGRIAQLRTAARPWLKQLYRRWQHLTLRDATSIGLP